LNKNGIGDKRNRMSGDKRKTTEAVILHDNAKGLIKVSVYEASGRITIKYCPADPKSMAADIDRIKDDLIARHKIAPEHIQTQAFSFQNAPS
jgi:hypothetical protein